MLATSLHRFRRWFWRPPRAHGEVEEDRRVSYLELFYDLVFVVVISQAAHHLAGHPTARGALDFAVVFGVIWVAWANGSIYLEVHGREDGRTRAFTFLQMGILALLATFTADAAGSTGAPFAVVYVAFLVVMTWLWYAVRRQDSQEYMGATAAYLVGMVLSILVIGASAVLPDEARIVVWAAFVLGWAVGILAMGRRGRRRERYGVTATDSMVERFGLLTIIVLGEVVVGVVDGLSAAPHDALTIATGLLALVVGFGLWWLYFDIVGRRLPRDDPFALSTWMVSHFPATLGVAAAGAAMVGLVEHAHEAHTPPETALILAGAVALVLASLVVTVGTLVDRDRLAPVYQRVVPAMLLGAAGALLLGWIAPPPWLLAVGLAAILSVIWVLAVLRFIKAGAWGDEVTGDEVSGDEPAGPEG
jgi:low temperature requirement protein LtrA